MQIIKPSYKIEAPNPLDGLAILRAIEEAGRTCWKSEERITGDSAPRFVRMILGKGHLSVLEHRGITVRFICDRGVSHELVRHRICSFSQESTRFCDYNKTGDVQFIEPPGLTDRQWVYWHKACEDAESAHKALRAEGAKPEIARSVLPTCLKTEIVVTANLREWRLIFQQRTAPAAHPSMRQLMIPLLTELQEKIHVVFDDIQPSEASA